MNGDKRNFSLSIWDHKDNFICNLKSANLDFEGQSFNENFNENINGEKTLTFSIPMYIFSYNKDENGKDNFVFKQNNPWNQNEIWKQIKNEQKIRYIEYHPITNEPIRIEEFVLKEFTESRNGEEKIADCVCESLAVYELGKVGWGITFDTNYITDYELSSHEENIEGTTTLVSNCSDLLTIDYWMKKLLYKETNLGRVSNTTECTYLLQGLQLRDNEGYPIHSEIIATTTSGNELEYKYNRIIEPIATIDDLNQYLNEKGWFWEVQANYENDPEKQSISTLYETPVINQFIETFPGNFEPQSYQKRIGENDDTKILRRHPIPDSELSEWTYVTDIKKRLITEERSNLFSIIQNLCETFEVWADFQYHYDTSGKIDQRKILFKTESIDKNIKFDFSYGKNLQSVSRVKNSNDLITKLYITNAESNLVDGNILSIQQSSANPTGENYLYNFDYFYNSKMLTKEDQFDNDHKQNSDEYQINLHYGKLRELNNKIINIQKFLAPLYDRRDVLQGDLTIEEGSRIGYMDNIQAIQNKIDAIPEKDRIIKSWSADSNQYNHVGELKTYSTTSNPNGSNDEDWYYLNFGREDILINNINYYKYYIIEDEEGTRLIEEQDENFSSLSGYKPRVFIYNNWSSGIVTIEDNVINGKQVNNIIKNSTASTSIPYFIPFTEGNQIRYDYSSLGDHQFIKGIYFHPSVVNETTYGRIRYQYAPLAYYYLLIKDYWEKIGEVQIQIKNTDNNLLDIKNKIILYELELKKLLQEKNELILQFENKYKPFIREGYWEPSDYQSQLSEKIFDTNTNTNFNYFSNGTVDLNTLNLNDSLSTYSYYFNLGKANQIDIDSIKMRVLTRINGVSTYIPHYQGNNYELYLSGSNLICAIDPSLITKYNNNPDYKDKQEFYQSEVSYKFKNTDTYTSTTINWINNPSIVVNIPKIYLNNENIITDKLKIYGDFIDEKDSNLLIPYEDYSYTYESVTYDSNGNYIDSSQQESYSTDIQYRYSLRIDFKLTNNTIKFLSKFNPHFYVQYGEETTLQYIYNDAVATSKKYAIPQVEYNISVVDLSLLNEYENYSPKLGQKIPIFDSEMNFYNFEGLITSIEYSLEEKYNTNLTIATYTTKFEDIFQKLTATMSDITYNSNDIYKAVDSFNSDGTIKTDVFKKSLQNNFEAVNLGINNEITIDEIEGITLKDNDNNYGVKLIGRGIFLTKDITQGISTEWRTGITGEGINTDALTAGSLDTKQITIWNSSEKQARFIWNEQGLFAYGDKFGENTSTSTSYKELIDYNKYVKFNQEGLEFTDNGKSALSLGWQGLKISAQENNLVLDANKGLILTQQENNTNITRLELGKLDNGTLYGLRLRDINGEPTLQTDSKGDLWLHKHLQIGGSLTEDNVAFSTSAGIYGITTEVPVNMQMGVMRTGSTGAIKWVDSALRFYAGPQTKQDYLKNLSMTEDDVENISNWKKILDYDPVLSRFKVDEKGNIIASGVDVGGWIGAGNILRSSNYEALLRSGSYKRQNNENYYPVLAIGQSTASATGVNYHFRVYRDGRVVADNIEIISNTAKVYGGNIAGLTINNLGLESTVTVNNVKYVTGLYGVSGSTAYAFRSGPENNPNFSVDGFGNLIAQNANITGKITATSGEIGQWKIENKGISAINDNGSATYIRPNSSNNNPVIYIGSTTNTSGFRTSENTSFAVTGNGDVYFHKGIYGWSNTEVNGEKIGFRKGLTSAQIKEIYTAFGTTVSVEICQGLIVDMR